MTTDPHTQTAVHTSDRGRIVVMGSAYDVRPENRGRDVAVNASYCGVLPARFVGEQLPRGAIGVDCGIGPQGASIAGLWYLEALNVGCAVADVMTVRLGDGHDLYENGVVSLVNRPARDCGVQPGMPVRDAALAMLENDPESPKPDEVSNRAVVLEGPAGRGVVCTDSIAFGLPEDRDTNVLVTAGHTGVTAVPYLERVHPYGFICSDGGGGRDRSGMAGMYAVEASGLAGATVDARGARMGDAMSTYLDGVISARNRLAADAGVEVGMPCREAARILVNRPPSSEGD